MGAREVRRWRLRNDYWHRGRCPAYGEGVSFWALGEMVRRRAGLAEGDDETTTRQHLHETVEEYVADEAERDWIERALLTLLAVDAQTQSSSETLFAAWRRFFENVAAKGPTVLVFEDLHWADSGLLDCLAPAHSATLGCYAQRPPGGYRRRLALQLLVAGRLVGDRSAGRAHG